MTVVIPKNTTRADEQGADLLDRGRQSTDRQYPCLAGRERPMAADKQIAGPLRARRHSTGAARGVPQIEVGFDIDANGILSVQAR